MFWSLSLYFEYIFTFVFNFFFYENLKLTYFTISFHYNHKTLHFKTWFRHNTLYIFSTYVIFKVKVFKKTKNLLKITSTRRLLTYQTQHVRNIWITMLIRSCSISIGIDMEHRENCGGKSKKMRTMFANGRLKRINLRAIKAVQNVCFVLIGIENAKEIKQFFRRWQNVTKRMGHRTNLIISKS